MKRDIISYWELSEDWRKEAISNLDKTLAEKSLYLEPLESDNPKEHVLWDLSECFPIGNQKGVITISNNSALKLYFNSDYSQAVMKFI